MQAVNVGPVLLSVGVLALLLGFGAAHAVAAFMRRRGHADVRAALWWLLLAALVVARVVYVAHWWSAYAAAPWWSTFDVRDAGFEWIAGIIVLAVGTLLLMRERPAWQRALPIAVTAGVAAWALVGLVAWQLQASARAPLPDVTLHRLDGSTVSLASLRGEPMVINLWATWCPPCRREMPMLMAAARDMPHVRFVFADQGESAAQVRAFLAREGLSDHAVVIDGNRDLARYYHVPGYPTTLFVGADGHLRDTRVGALSRATLQQHLASISRVPSVPES